MNFASKAAFLKAADEEEGEEVYEADMMDDMPESVPVQPPARQIYSFDAMPSIPEDNADMYQSGVFQPPVEEAKKNQFASLAPGSAFSSSLAGKPVNLVREQQPVPMNVDPFQSLSAGAGFSASLQGKEVNLIKAQPQAPAPGQAQFNPFGDSLAFAPPSQPQAPSLFSGKPGVYRAPQQPQALSGLFGSQPMAPGLGAPQQSQAAGGLFGSQPMGFGAPQQSQAASGLFGSPPMAPGFGAPQQPQGSFGSSSSSNVFIPPAKKLPPPQLPPAPPMIQQMPMMPPPMAAARAAPGGYAPPPAFASAPMPKFGAMAPQKPRGQVYRHQVDSNVVDIPLNVLKEETPIATGDPQLCAGCRSLLNATSAVRKEEGGTYLWKCEFCDHENQIMIDAEEVPRDNKVTYVLESAAEMAHARRQVGAGSTVLFVLDTSGSMCVTQATPGKFALKTSHLSKDFEGLLQRDDGDQYFPGQDRNTTYVSRLECVQAAIEAQLTDIALTTPDTHVGLITFSEEVRLIGDGLHEVIVAGDKLSASADLLREVQGKYQYFLGRTITETKEILLGKVLAMQEKGATALGPAAFMAVQLAREGGPGSKVILCTDGIANIGLGSLEDNIEASLAFYQSLSEAAKEASITVSVLSIEGEECKLNALLPLAVNTGGEVNKVNPLRIRDDFANVLSTKSIATGVEITVNLHKALKFRNVEPQYLQQNGSRLVRKMGTVCENETFMFEYCTKSKRELQTEGVDLSGLKQVPFQVLVQYDRADGMRCVFADTQVQNVTSDRESALQQAEFDLLARNAQLQSSNMVMEGRYQEAQLNSMAWGQAMRRNQMSGAQMASVQDYYQSSAPLYNQVNEQMRNQMPAPQAMMRAAQPDSVALAAHKQQQVSRKKPS